MINNRSFFFFLLFQCVFITQLWAAFPGVYIVNLKTEYTEMPLGLDVELPRFSWQMQSTIRGIRQAAYRIQVSDEKGHQVWNSQKKKDDHAVGIPYAGNPLKPRTRYTWKVEVWDESGYKYQASSWFETGLLAKKNIDQAWNNAKWIGGSDQDMPLYAMYLPVFRIDFSLQLDGASKSKNAGFLYGGNDPRLLDAHLNHQGMKNQKDSSYIKVVLDITPLASGSAAQVHIYRRGYTPAERKETKIKSFDIPQNWLNENNKYQKHQLYITSVLGQTEIYLQGQNTSHRVGAVNLNPLGQGGDFIAFPVLGHIGLFIPEGNRATFSDLSIRNFRSPQNALYAEDALSTATNRIFSSQKGISMHNGNYFCQAGKESLFLLVDPTRNAVPMLRTEFSVRSKKIKKARLYVTARGIYEVYLNGKRISDAYFNPGLTQYNKTHLYQTFDVTAQMKSGENALGAVLSEGWWSGGATYMGEFWNFFGDRQSLLGQLIITYSDGSEQVVQTKPDTWQYYNDGPVRYGSFFQGEVYDASKEKAVEGWSTAAYHSSDWKQAASVSLQGNISLDERNKQVNMPMVDDYSNFQMYGDIGPAVQEVKELTAVAVEEIRPGVYLYNMGQNMAGVPAIELKDTNPGDTIRIRLAEVRYPALAEYAAHKGTIMLENIRAAMAQNIYITKGGKEKIAPRFTYHGYQYVEISGLAKALPLHAVKGKVLSSIHKFSSHYESSDSLVNKLWENVTWSTLSNFIAIPTDCPQRNERLGWSGDISVFARTATYLADIPQFLQKHMRAMRDVQDPNGRFPDVAPLGGGFGGVLWGSAGITVAWESYQQYGDKLLLAEHYDAMKAYIDYLSGQIDPKTGVLCENERNNWGSLGDWLSPEYNKTEKSLLWEAYYLFDLDIMHQVALVLDKPDDAHLFAAQYQNRKEFFTNTYIDPITDKTSFRQRPVDTQASYALPLQFNLWNTGHRDQVIDNFVQTIVRENKADDGNISPPYSLMTGFIGTAWINHALSKHGRSDVAYRLLLQDTYPSWLYPVTQGATTIWERLNSYTHSDGFGGNNRMNSFNHYSFGAVGAWLYEHSLGIQRVADKPAFKQFILAPEVDPSGKMSYAKGYVDTPYGRIESSWEKTDRGYVYHFTIPPNTSARLSLQAHSKSQVVFGTKGTDIKAGFQYRGQSADKQEFDVEPGNYEILVLSDK